MREGASVIKHCKKLLTQKDSEYEKTTERLEKEIRKSQARCSSGSRGALIGIKSVNRTKVQLEKIVKVKAYLNNVMTETKQVMIKGKDKPEAMTIPYDLEKITKGIKNVEKEVEKSDSQTSAGSLESFAKELEELDRAAVQQTTLF